MHRLFAGSSLLLLAVTGLVLEAADPPAPDSPAAKLTRETKLKALISVDSTDGSGMMLREIIDEITSSVRDAKVDGKKVGTIRIKPDPKAGITLTTRIKFKSSKEPVDVVLEHSGALIELVSIRSLQGQLIGALGYLAADLDQRWVLQIDPYAGHRGEFRSQLFNDLIDPLSPQFKWL